MGKKYTTDELEVGGHMLDASMMGSLNTIVSAGSHALAGYLTTYTDTTYSVGNGGLTEINFTSALNTKLAGIAASANNYVLPFTNNSANWDTAYGWGNHASKGYGTFSNDIYLNDSTTTDSFIAELTNEYGAFQDNYKVFKVSWSYAGNSDLNVGFETIELAGCLIECWGGVYKHIRVTRPTTGSGGRSIYVYNDQGSNYSPGWRQIWTSDEFNSTNITTWNTAYGWGNHASAGYVTSSGNTIIGTDADINTSGATIIDNLYMTDGVITSHGTRNLTLGDLGYTGATNANYITNNNQLTNGASYLTTSSKAADSNLLDGIDSTSFLRSDVYNSASDGLQVFRNIGTVSPSWVTTQHTLGLENSDAGYVSINFHRAGYTSHNIYYTGTEFITDDSFRSIIDLRAPIFYDSNNTGYYVDPASTSNLNLINATGGNSTQWNTAYGWGNHAGLYAAASHNHAQYIVEGGTSFSGVYPMVVRVGATSYYSDQDITFTGASSQLYVGGSVRTPILYDSDNTNRYLDPAGISKIHAVWAVGSGENSVPRWDTSFHVMQSQHWYGHSSSQVMYLGEFGNPVILRGSLRIGASASADSGMALTVSGNANATSSFRAPIFYDSNNTNYYVNPNGESNLYKGQFSQLGLFRSPDASTSSYKLAMGGNIHMYNNTIDYVAQLHFQDNVRFYDDGNDSYLNFKYGDATTGGIKFLNGGGTVKGYVFANAESFGLLDAGGNWAVKTAVGAAPLTLSSNSNPEFYVYDSYTVSPGSSRAPIFYDYNNTAYYLNPYGHSNLQGMQIGSGDLKMYENGSYSSELRFQNNTHHMGIDYQNNETLRFITRSGTTTVPITFQMRAGTITAANFILSSDERKKTKIVDLPCDNIDVSWKSFEMKDNEGEYRTGVIAQELEQKHPEFVNTDDEGFKSVKYIDLLIAKIAELEARLEKLEN